MAFLTDLWLPILVSSVAVFFLSSLIHMGLRYHMRDYLRLPDEQDAIESIRGREIPPGDYMFPHCENMADLATEEMQTKFKEGPVGMLTLMPSGPPTMGKQLLQWFAFTVVMSVFIAYVASLTVSSADSFGRILRVVSAVTFLAYVGAEPMQSIWKRRSWGTTARFGLDGVFYGLATGAVFAWLWPAA
ncbi:MAG: hypothetical protein AAGG01_08050 [Planctomycetota bacterium]